jgi:hypothetical protein
MKFYITEETKQEIEAKIAELEYLFEREGEKFDSRYSGKYYLLKEINSSATILPVEESWDTLHDKLLNAVVLPRKLKDKSFHEENYPNGVIIQPKQ